MQLPDVRALPEAVSASRLEPLFFCTLTAAAAEADKVSVLLELSDKQWHTYELVSSVLAKDLSAFLKNAWQPDDLPRTEALLSIIGHLGLTDAMSFLMEQAQGSASSASVRSAILEASKEFGSAPFDPYLGMPAHRS